MKITVILLRGCWCEINPCLHTSFCTITYRTELPEKSARFPCLRVFSQERFRHVTDSSTLIELDAASGGSQFNKLMGTWGLEALLVSRDFKESSPR